MTTFHDILAKYRAISFSERDQGDRFERLMQAFLLTIPWYEGKFRHVWLWRELSYKQNLGSKAESSIHHQESPVRRISLTTLQNAVADRSKEINTADASKLIGGINALSKRMLIEKILKTSKLHISTKDCTKAISNVLYAGGCAHGIDN